jgi:hypothetical protein
MSTTEAGISDVPCIATHFFVWSQFTIPVQLIVFSRLVWASYMQDALFAYQHHFVQKGDCR